MNTKYIDIVDSLCADGGCKPETNYAYWIKQIGLSYLVEGCKETTENRGDCVDAIKVVYGDTRPLAEAWCAEFGFVLHRLACRILRAPEVLPKTKSALQMLQKSIAAGIRVDRTPEAGAVGYRRSLSPGASGHIFTVIAVRDNGKIYSVEGNVNDQVGLRYYDKSYYTDNENNVWFIHVEDYYRDYYTAATNLVFY